MMRFIVKWAVFLHLLANGHPVVAIAVAVFL